MNLSKKNNNYPLSSPQLDFWFDQILHPDVPLYNIGGYVRIDGPIDPTLFEQAIDRVIEENDALRIVIHGGEGLPRQTFAENVRINLDFQDFSTQENAREAAIAWMEQEFVKPFQLDEGLLFNFALCKAAENCYYWYQKYHHIIVDGWAISLIVQRVAGAYNALVTGTKLEVKDYSYQDFLQKDRAYPESAKIVKDRQYWQEKYRERPQPLLVRRDAEQFQGQTIPSQRSTLRVKRDFYNQLTDFAVRHKVSPFHVILSALYCYFVRTGARDDFTIGLPLLNRHTVACKKTVGMFMSVSPAWFRFGTDSSVAELMEKISQELHKEYRHQHLPLSEISQQVGEKGKQQPLFDLTLSYAKLDYDVCFNGNPSHSLYLSNGFYPQGHGLFITIEEFHHQDDVNIYFDYNQSFFEADDIERLQARLQFLLGEILREPSVPVRELQIIPDAEFKQQLKFHHNGCACENIEAGIEYVKEIYDVTDIGEIVFDEYQDASVCLVKTNNKIDIELVAGNQVKSLLNRGISLYHVCYEVTDFWLMMEKFIAKGAVVISEAKPAPLFNHRLVAFLNTHLGLVELLEEKKSRISSKPNKTRHYQQRIAVSATFTAEPLQESLDFWMQELALPYEVEFAPYNQVFQQLLDPSSLLSKNETGINVVLVRLQDWVKSADRARMQAEIEENVQSFVQALNSAVQHKTNMVCICPSNLPWAEELLASKLAGIESLYLIKYSEIIKNYPVSRIYDRQAEELGQIPYTSAFFTALGTTIARKIHAVQRHPYKVIVLDCDNTLWQGVCAEDGVQNLKIDSPHQALQTFMLAQQQAGKLLCLCSKNHEADVLAVFEGRSDMSLKREHLVAWRINWQPKSENLKSLSAELDLGLSSFIFIDDNPVECAEVRANCPAVTTIQLPADLNHWEQFLDRVWAFDNLNVTAEDQERTRYYQERQERDRFHEQAPTLADFLAGLKLEVEISPMTASQLSRVSQLTKRTNQFNFTTIRRTEAEIKQLWESGAFESLVVEVRDRFGDYGLVGAILFESAAKAIRVDTFLLSCRALGRGVEHQMLARLGKIAAERQLNSIEILCLPTQRNQAVLDFLESIGSEFKRPIDRGWQYRFPVELASELTYSPPVEEIAPSPQQVPTTSDRNSETEIIQSESTLFNRIATELYDAQQILERIKSQNRQSQASTGTYVAPRTPVEELLAGIWADVLNIERVGIHDNFFKLGGHSLIGTQVMSRIRDTFAVGLPLHLLFELPTIAQLSTRLHASSRESSLPPITRVERDKPLQLSFAQQRLWFLDKLEEKSATYNLAAAVRLDGQLNRRALEHSFQALVERHESLRTTFPTLNGAPVVQISHESFQFEIFELQTLSQAEREPEVRRLLKEEPMRPFDLATGPLFRAALLQLDATSHIVLIVLHHIIADGWSFGVFVREWRVLYEAALTGKPASLPPLPIQYVDFAAWQRQWLVGEVLEGQLKYWEQQLANLPELLELPTDYPRPPIQRYQGASLSFSLSDELTARLKQLSQETGTTLFMILWSAFAVLLSRYSGQQDIAIGSPIANRNHREIESLIGFFVNTLVLRLDLAENPPFEEVLQQARRVALEAYAHQDIPFERLVEALQPERHLSHSPLFQVMFVLQNAPLPDMELAGLSLTLLEVKREESQFDLTLEFTETASELAAKLEYNTDLFKRETIERLSGHLQTLLEGIVANPQQRLSELPLLTERERHQLLVEWNDTQVDYPQDKCIHQLFEEQVEKTPDAIAVVFQEQQLTYRELNAKANQLARYLQTLGVKPEVLVGICIERSLEMVVGIFGILKAGGAYLPLDPTYPAERLAFMLEDARVPVLLTRSSLKEKLPKTKAQVVCLDIEAEMLSRLSSENLSSGVMPANLAYVIYTSGSTGKPKGVMISHQAICNHTQWMQDTFPLNVRDKVLQKTPISFDASLWEFYAPLVAGAQLVIAPPDWQKDSRSPIEIIARHQVTVVQMVPSLLQVLLSIQQIETLQSLKRIFCGGEKLPVTLMERSLNTFNIDLINLYGPTEACIDATFWQCSAKESIVPIGHPIANTRIYILDPHLQLVPVGVPGELYISGAGLARGYLNRPELTAEKFISNPFSDDRSSRLYKTGDLARYLPDGNIEYLGRIDNQVKIRGFRIELSEIETALAQHPDVQEAIAIVQEEQPGDKRLVAYLVSDLIPDRIPYQTDCLIQMQDNHLTVRTVDISSGGLGLDGLDESQIVTFAEGQELKIGLQLPIDSEMRWLKGEVRWLQESEMGIAFNLTVEQQAIVEQSVQHLLETNGILKMLQRQLTNRLRNHLKKKLPDYMIPSAFVVLSAFPLTPNGKIDRRALSEMPANPYGLSEETFVAPRTADEELLASIWTSVLGIDRVGIHDNFFDLGGHSLLAVSLLAQIERQFGQNLPLSTLFQSPTIAELAKLIEPSTNTINQWSPLVAIQPNGSKPPFFCLPGAGGNVLYFQQLACHLGEDRPFYGLQAIGLDGETAPETRVEDMAARYIQEIQTVQPQGPYLLGGHSFGAGVALEMAKQLQLQGHSVARLAIFDSTVPFNQPIGIDWNQAQWITEVAYIVGRLLNLDLEFSYAELQQLETQAQLNYLHEILTQNSWHISLKQLDALVKVFKANCQTNYLPREIPAIPISLFKASDIPLTSQSGAQMESLRQHLKLEPSWGWSQYADGVVDIHVVPGDHHTMMSQPQVQVLAEKLKVCLERSMASI